jgi:hypothetical protein
VDDLAIAGYDQLTADEITAKLTELSQIEQKIITLDDASSKSRG